MSDSAANSGKKVKKGAPRGQAYSDAECIIITRAMIAAKNDPVRGSGQKKENLLDTFRKKYTALVHGSSPDRSIQSLAEKFKDIYHDCHHFLGMVVKVANDRPSGSTSSDAGDEMRVCTASSNLFNYNFTFRQCTCMKLFTELNSNTCPPGTI
jgi:hypothetical protein